MPHVHTDEPEELWNTWSGYWYIDGIEQWVEGQYPDWHGWLDTDSDGLPDWADPYPSDNSNNTTWSSSGFWYVDYMDQWFDSYPYATTNPVDADQNGLPDSYDHNYPIDGTNTPWSTYGGYWSSQGVEDWTMLGIYPGNMFGLIAMGIGWLMMWTLSLGIPTMVLSYL